MEFELWFEHNRLECVLNIVKQTPLENPQTRLTGLHMHLASTCGMIGKKAGGTAQKHAGKNTKRRIRQYNSAFSVVFLKYLTKKRLRVRYHNFGMLIM